MDDSRGETVSTHIGYSFAERKTSEHLVIISVDHESENAKSNGTRWKYSPCVVVGSAMWLFPSTMWSSICNMVSMRNGAPPCLKSIIIMCSDFGLLFLSFLLACCAFERPPRSVKWVSLFVVFMGMSCSSWWKDCLEDMKWVIVSVLCMGGCSIYILYRIQDWFLSYCMHVFEPVWFSLLNEFLCHKNSQFCTILNTALSYIVLQRTIMQLYTVYYTTLKYTTQFCIILFCTIPFCTKTSLIILLIQFYTKLYWSKLK